MRIRLLLLALLTLLPQLAAAAATAQVLESFPAGTRLSLPTNQSYYLRIRYESDAPIKLWVRPYLRGKPANAGSNPSLTHPAGTGEALGWFFLMNAGDAVDEIRIEGGDGSVNGTHVLQRLPVDIVGVAAGATRPAEPQWVGQMRAADDARATQERVRIEQESRGGGGAGLAMGFMAGVLLVMALSVAWPIRAVRHWQGGWRIAAMVPLAVMGFVVLRILVGGMIDPTSHNLWPFEIALAGLGAVGAMVVFTALRWMQGVSDE